MGTQHQLKTLLWISIVYVLSFLSYAPELLKRHGIALPSELFLLKYLFVCIPAITAVFLLIFEHNFKAYFARMFSGEITVKHILTWAMFTAAGIFTSYCYSMTEGADLFASAYLSPTAFLINCIYLFITALIEEIAWRGFLLERISAGKESVRSIMFVGIIWIIWHMPMWIIRNSLGIEQIAYLCVWTFLISIILGTTYYECRNILLIAMLHATFNIGYLAPIQFNIVILAIAIGMLLIKNRGKGIKT